MFAASRYRFGSWMAHTPNLLTFSASLLRGQFGAHRYGTGLAGRALRNLSCGRLARERTQGAALDSTRAPCAGRTEPGTARAGNGK
ncbi:MAG: hypothetical protein JNJ60_17015 [Rhodocyclaceae bacterium]|nr:hypothetical protein [Rhodocyclaceae bacterium]